MTTEEAAEWEMVSENARAILKSRNIPYTDILFQLTAHAILRGMNIQINREIEKAKTP